MNKEEEKEVTLKSAININQKFDFKSKDNISIYKGYKYDAYNIIKDNIPFAILDRNLLSAEDFNKVLDVDIKQSSNIFSLYNPVNLRAGFQLLKILEDDIEEGEINGVDYYITNFFSLRSKAKEEKMNLQELIEKIKKEKIEEKMSEISNDRIEILLSALGSKFELIDVLNLAKEGFNLSNLDLVYTKAELRPLFQD